MEGARGLPSGEAPADNRDRMFAALWGRLNECECAADERRVLGRRSTVSDILTSLSVVSAYY
jgi:hypothetical protein